MKYFWIVIMIAAVPFVNIDSLHNTAQLNAQQTEETLQEPGSETLAPPEETLAPPGSDESLPPLQGEQQVPDELRFYKEKYEQTFDQPFEIVWNAIIKAVEENNCMFKTKNYRTTDEGFFKGSIQSDFCVFTQGKDSTFDVLKRYSLEMPMIRGGNWVNGRIQYKFIIKEQEDGMVYMLMKTELSGFEEYVTYEVHFWQSNGLLEKAILDRINELIAAAAEEY